MLPPNEDPFDVDLGPGFDVDIQTADLSYGAMFEDPASAPKAIGKIIVTAQSDELILDIDSIDDLGKVGDNDAILADLEPRLIATMKSQTEGHFHVYYKVNRPITPLERTALELALGSDRRHGALQLRAILGGRASAFTSCAFETPENAKFVEDRRKGYQENVLG